jgi:SAM-dependent methyltransferase
MTNEPVIEPGSFRDRTATVFYHRGDVFRGLTERAHRQWQALSTTDFYRRYVLNGGLVQTRQVDPSTVLPSEHQRWTAVLRHARVPFVSYPYEWPFGMLKDAALLQIDLLLAALDEGMTLKDATPFNIQWNGTAPVFVDVASFERWVRGELWVGYRQFCQMFLYPLFLQAYRDVPYHPWLRGSLEGIEAETCRRMMSARDFLRRGVLTHVYLQARAQAAWRASTRDIRAELRATGFGTTPIENNARRLRRLVAGLRWKRGASRWSEYGSCTHYKPEDAARKRDFVREVVHLRDWPLVWDLGANLGTFSRIAAERANYVVAIDADHLAVERLYQQLKVENSRTILPLVGDLADPSPDLGWRNRERRQLAERGRPDLVLCLALVHHMVIDSHVSLSELLDWLAGLGADLIIEFVTRDDPIVARLLHNRDDQHADYTLEAFDRELALRFGVHKREPLSSGTRVMYYARSIHRS